MRRRERVVGKGRGEIIGKKRAGKCCRKRRGEKQKSRKKSRGKSTKEGYRRVVVIGGRERIGKGEEVVGRGRSERIEEEKQREKSWKMRGRERIGSEHVKELQEGGGERIRMDAREDCSKRSRRNSKRGGVIELQKEDEEKEEGGERIGKQKAGESCRETICWKEKVVVLGGGGEGEV